MQRSVNGEVVWPAKLLDQVSSVSWKETAVEFFDNRWRQVVNERAKALLRCKLSKDTELWTKSAHFKKCVPLGWMKKHARDD